jgi:GNAT superfamily N-acetyltransferase
MENSLRIRPYEQSDERAVVALVQELQRHEAAFYDRMLPPEDIGAWYVIGVLREAKDAGGDLLVALIDGRIVGYATLLANVSSKEERDEMLFAYAYVGDLVVEPQSRGKGIGRALLAECEKLARAAGRKWLRISVLAGNQAAHCLYAAFGFAELSHHMEKPLS